MIIDTNIVIHAERQALTIAEIVPDDDLAIAAVTMAELIYGGQRI